MDNGDNIDLDACSMNELRPAFVCLQIQHSNCNNQLQISEREADGLKEMVHDLQKAIKSMLMSHCTQLIKLAFQWMVP